MSGTGIYDAASLRWAADVDWGPLQEFLGVDEGPSEKELVLDALFALGGVDGKFLYLDNERQVYDIDDSFNVAPWNRYLTPRHGWKECPVSGGLSSCLIVFGYAVE